MIVRFSKNFRSSSTYTRLCVNCTKFKPLTKQCSASKLIFYDSVTGEETYQLAKSARSNPDICGPTAKNYESTNNITTICIYLFIGGLCGLIIPGNHFY